MAFTQTDLDNIQAAIANGELTVRVNGKLVTYRSMEELMQAERRIILALRSSSQSGSIRHQLADFTE
ncbi:MAG TPA: hypothetical protein ENI94_12905 [Gammaproteobacteria bacterium]|nr:hypothetical protein [Gammaproteobacteria bacterium]